MIGLFIKFFLVFHVAVANQLSVTSTLIETSFWMPILVDQAGGKTNETLVPRNQGFQLHCPGVL